ncbi:MAG: benzoate-CoA ligase family protein [Bacillati bacterium ANGP1]|uniref:Benzoate-CoA ligase family protein n=1 Tax=Candidatus Segetimicrobium genomatis TaxID=2569760 RepID=A0A537K1S3_9BACT|nr:MAG: benzoate-CoA ligase family protein [Terrabacteria group bacterium ANGP1]
MTPAVDLPEEFNASTAFLDRNLEQGRGDRVAIYAGDDRITYRTLLAQVNRAGNALRSLGVHAEERVLLLMLDSPELAYLFWGAIRIGAVAVPTCTALTTRDYAYMLRDSRAGVVVVSEALLPVLEPALADLPAVRHVVVAGAPGKADRIEEWTNGRGRHALADLMAAASPELVPAATHRDEPAFWLWSSGSTGAPKGTVHLHHDMVVTAEHYARAVLDIREHDICLSIAKLFFAYGLGNALYFPFRVGAAAVLYPGRFEPRLYFDLIRRYRPTLFFGVPTAYAAMLAADGPADLGAVRLCVSAGEPLPAALFNRWKERFGVEILDGIGSTEVLHIYISNRAGRVRPGSSGEVVPGYGVKIVGEDGREVPPGEIGDLLVSGDSIASGYWNKHERTKQAFRGDWFVSGDKYYRDPEGYHWYCGRSDDMLKAGGQWVSPAEVEAALIQHPAVLECGVVGRADRDELVKPYAFVVLKPGHRADDALAEELQAFVRSKIAAYKYPRWIEFTPELPKTATGKIQRFRLRERLAERQPQAPVG